MSRLLECEANIQHVADIVFAFVSNNSIPHHSIGDLIASVAEAIDRLGKAPVEIQAELVPAVSVRKSIHQDYLISLETGQKFKTLKRHLLGLGMTPEEYRAKWGLSTDYPMTAKSYSDRRSELARQIGLGNSVKRVSVKATETDGVKKSRGRPRKDAA